MMDHCLRPTAAEHAYQERSDAYAAALPRHLNRADRRTVLGQLMVERAEVARLKKHVEQLQEQVRDLGGRPV